MITSEPQLSSLFFAAETFMVHWWCQEEHLASMLHKVTPEKCLDIIILSVTNAQSSTSTILPPFYNCKFLIPHHYSTLPLSFTKGIS